MKTTVMRVPTYFRRRNAFPKVEASGTSLTGSNEEHVLVKNDIGAYSESNHMLAAFESNNSKGNFITDVDGSTLLDLNSMETLPLGYNHDDFVAVVNAKEWDMHMINPGMNNAQRATADFINGLDGLKAVKPSSDLSSVTLTDGSSAVEHAIFAAMAVRGSGHRQSALGFTDSFHGNSLVLAQWAHPNCGPSLNWPAVEYPKNAQEEERALEAVRQKLQAQNDEGVPVAAIVIEPTASQSGHSASDSFIQQLYAVAHENGAALIVDETNTGAGASGKGFWHYSGPADYVTFGKRTQLTGYYTSESTTDEVNTMGNSMNLKRFDIIKNAIEKGNLVDRVNTVGATLLSDLERVASKSEIITGVRGSGTQLWIDTDSRQNAGKLRKHLAEHGVLVKANGIRGVMTKPALILDGQQGSVLTSALSKF